MLAVGSAISFVGPPRPAPGTAPPLEFSALRAFDHILEVAGEPRNEPAFRHLVAEIDGARKAERVRAAVTLDRNPVEPENLAYLAVYRTNSGDHAAARIAIEHSLALAPESPSTHYFAAILEMNSGNDEKALSELAKAARLGYSYKLLGADPEFAELRENAGFRAMLAEHED